MNRLVPPWADGTLASEQLGQGSSQMAIVACQVRSHTLLPTDHDVPGASIDTSYGGTPPMHTAIENDNTTQSRRCCAHPSNYLTRTP